MKQKNIELLVTYKFKVNYQHNDHLRDIKKELKKHPINNMAGAGVASDWHVYGYSCKLVKSVQHREEKL